MQPARQTRAQPADDEKTQREENDLAQSVPRKAEPPAPCEWIILWLPPITADVAQVFQIARIDDVVPTVRTYSLAVHLHAPDVGSEIGAEHHPARYAPGAFDAEAKAAAGLNALGRLRPGG